MITVIQLLGGKGTRLKEITKSNIPKPLVEIKGYSLLELQIKHLISFGCKDFIWICHYMSEAFEREKNRLLKKYNMSIDSIEIYQEQIPLSTFGSLRNAINHRNEKEYMVLYGDILINFDLYRFKKSFMNFRDSDNHILTRYSNHPEDSDKIVINENGYITKFISKKELTKSSDPATTTSGIYLARRSFFDKLSHWSSQKCDLYSEVLPKDGFLVKSTAYHSTEFILDIGTTRRYKLAEKLLNKESYYRKSYLFSNPSLLLDRDGVVIKEDGYITDQNQIIFNDKLIKVMRFLKTKGILVGIITNQPLVAQGRINNFKHELIKNFIINHLSKLSAIDFYYECKHHPEKGFKDEVPFLKHSCYCRKPKTYLFQNAIHDHNLDIDKTFYFGDNNTDYIAGQACNIKSFIYQFPENKSSKNNLSNSAQRISEPEQILELFEGFYE